MDKESEMGALLKMSNKEVEAKCQEFGLPSVESRSENIRQIKQYLDQHAQVVPEEFGELITELGEIDEAASLDMNEMDLLLNEDAAPAIEQDLDVKDESVLGSGIDMSDILGEPNKADSPASSKKEETISNLLDYLGTEE